MRTFNRIFLIGVLALMMAACADTGTVDPGPEPQPDPIVDAPAHDFPDGEVFAWVKGLTGDGFLLDAAELLSGEEAREAAVTDGVIEPGEDVPNDVYIRDVDDTTLVVMPASDASYELLLFDSSGSPVATSVTYNEVADALNDAHPDVYGVFEGTIPATVVISGGEIVELTQVYLP